MHKHISFPDKSGQAKKFRFPYYHLSAPQKTCLFCGKLSRTGIKAIQEGLHFAYSAWLVVNKFVFILETFNVGRITNFSINVPYCFCSLLRLYDLQIPIFQI
jgi:hypothetical protein